MATDRELLELLARALGDEEFRARLFDDPRQAARAAGYDLTLEQLAAVKAIDLQSIAEELEGLDERMVRKIMRAAQKNSREPSREELEP